MLVPVYYWTLPKAPPSILAFLLPEGCIKDHVAQALFVLCEAVCTLNPY